MFLLLVEVLDFQAPSLLAVLGWAVTLTPQAAQAWLVHRLPQEGQASRLSWAVVEQPVLPSATIPLVVPGAALHRPIRAVPALALLAR